MTKGAEVFAVNDRVTHSVYGLGTISEMNVRHTTIVFDEAGGRKFLTDIVQLQHSSTAAPAKRSGSKSPKAKK